MRNGKVKRAYCRYRFNRYIVECKFDKIIKDNKDADKRFNRYIVECKSDIAYFAEGWSN